MGKMPIQDELEKLKLNDKILEAIIDASFDELFVTNGDGKTLRVSKGAYLRLYGVNPQDLVGKNVQEMETEGSFNPSVFPRILQEKRAITFVQQTSEGREMLVTSTPVFGEDGEIEMVVSNSRDITELIDLQVRIEKAESLNKQYEEEIISLRNVLLNLNGHIIVASPQMKGIMQMVSKISQTDTTVLILGPSGVGKDVVAKTLHRLSYRADKPFIKINCAAIPESLIEAELFGYEKGAFTGARKEGKRGLMELADDGTLFLDEIGELPLSVQAKLLNFLQEKTMLRVGGTKSIVVDVRIIAATNRNLEEMIKEKMFREDLYYRLAVIPIHIPPLKERPDDISQLIIHYCQEFSQKYNLKRRISPEAFDLLMAYPWPGNIRELQNLIERLVVTANESVITTEDIPDKIQKAALGNQQFILGETANNGSLKEILNEVEKKVLKLAVQRYKTTRKVADSLGISQTAVVKKLKKHNMNTENRP